MLPKIWENFLHLYVIWSASKTFWHYKFSFCIFFTARAEAYKDDGNIQYKKKQFKKAIKNYTEGIKIKCENNKLNAILYTNRATAHSYLGKVPQLLLVFT